MLAQQIAVGKPPKVEDRPPANPYVVPNPWAEEGRDGGTMHRLSRRAPPEGTWYGLKRIQHDWSGS